MIANSSKFHAIIIRKDRKDTEGMAININGKVLKTESEVPLLGITFDNRLTFDIGNICKKAANQLNTLKSLAYCLNYMQKKMLALHRILIIVPLFGTSVQLKISIKWNVLKNKH